MAEIGAHILHRWGNGPSFPLILCVDLENTHGTTFCNHSASVVKKMRSKFSADSLHR